MNNANAAITFTFFVILPIFRCFFAQFLIDKLAKFHNVWFGRLKIQTDLNLTLNKFRDKFRKRSDNIFLIFC